MTRDTRKVGEKTVSVKKSAADTISPDSNNF
jgi:hypothetical protein